MIRWLKYLWLAVNPFDPRLASIRELVREIAPNKASGQRKQNWVLNNAHSRFPESSRRDLSFLIERVVQMEESK